VWFFGRFELRDGLPAVIALVTLGQVCRFAVRRGWLASGRRERALVRDRPAGDLVDGQVAQPDAAWRGTLPRSEEGRRAPLPTDFR